jgi:hypothetical protein
VIVEHIEDISKDEEELVEYRCKDISPLRLDFRNEVPEYSIQVSLFSFQVSLS